MEKMDDAEGGYLIISLAVGCLFCFNPGHLLNRREAFISTVITSYNLFLIDLHC